MKALERNLKRRNGDVWKHALRQFMDQQNPWVKPAPALEGLFDRHNKSAVYHDDVPTNWTEQTAWIDFQDHEDLLNDGLTTVVRSITSADGKPIALRRMRDAMQDEDELDDPVLSIRLGLKMRMDGWEVSLYALAQDLNETHEVRRAEKTKEWEKQVVKSFADLDAGIPVDKAFPEVDYSIPDPHEVFVFSRPFVEKDIVDRKSINDSLYATTPDGFGGELTLTVSAGRQPLEYTYRLYRMDVPHAFSWFVEALERVGSFFWISFQEKEDSSFVCTANLGAWTDEVIIPRSWAKHFFVID